MKDINYYRRINGTYGAKNKRDVNIKKTQSALFKNILEHPNCQEVKFIDEGVKDYVIIITDKDKNKFLIRQPDKKIKRGDLIEWNSNVWLCLSIDEDETIYSKGVIQKTNHNLKWIDSSDNLITKPCIVSAQTLYTTGVKDEKVIEIPNGMIGIQIPYDDDTKKLDREDTFVFNKTKYKITFYNEAEYEGLIVLICTEIGTSHLDDKINEIADRWKEENGKKIDRLPWLDEQQPPIEPDEPTIPETGVTYTITAQMPYADIPDNEIWLDDPPAIYTVHKFVDGVETSGKFTFEVTNISIVTITETTDNTVSIIANDFAGKKNIILIATDTDTGQVAIEKEITICGR